MKRRKKIRTEIYLNQKFQSLPYKSDDWFNKRRNFWCLAMALKEVGFHLDDFRILFGYLKPTNRLPIHLEHILNFEIDYLPSDFEKVFEYSLSEFISKKYFTKTAYKKALKLAKEIKQVVDFYKN